MLKFNKLYTLLAMRGMKKTDLLAVLHPTTLAALGKRSIKSETIEKICEFLNVQPGDIMEYEKGE